MRPLHQFVRSIPLAGFSCAAILLSLATLPGADNGALPEITLAEGFKASVFADDSQFGNAVAIAFDTDGVLYSAEVNRRKTGALGVTWTRWWSMEDYAGLTLKDREDMYARWAHLVPPEQLTRNTDIVRRLEDRDGDGSADVSEIFAEGFNGPLEGNAAGIVTLGKSVYLANIPSLWRLEDRDRDGTADEREEMFRGLGVRVGVSGHDLHGLNWGPDGRLYFTVGDRGFNLVNHEGVELSGPTTGAAFRCFPDGSNLEVFHYGLRNPQDLAFNQLGDLFTVDNDMGGGDECRVVHVVEGGNSGWDASQQLTRNFREETDRHDHPEPPWVSELLWQTRHEGQPTWIHPPVAHLTNGPAGMEFDPGVGLPEKYRNAFFVCDFTGTGARSKIHSFHLEENGAGYEMTGSDHFALGILSADIEFGWDGALYATDWINGWAGEERRLLRITSTESAKVGSAAIVKGGFQDRDPAELATLLAHPDRRIRLLAQYELASRGPKSAKLFLAATHSRNDYPTRLQGIWGLWQLGLHHELSKGAASGLRDLLGDPVAEVRAQAAKVLGELVSIDTTADLLAALADPSPRVRYFAAIGLGKRAHAPALPAIVEMLRANNDRDVTLRHAGIFALSHIAKEDPTLLLPFVTDDSRLPRSRSPISNGVRHAVLLALRNLRSPELRRFLGDSDPALVFESIRAIHDLPIPECLEDLATLADSPLLTDPETPFPIAHRILNAGFRLGTLEHAERLAVLANNPAHSDEVRLEALRSLEKWDTPSPFDRVTWHHRPLTGDRYTDISAAIQPSVMAVFNGGKEDAPDLLRVAAKLIIKYDLANDDILRKSIAQTSLDTATRLAFFERVSSSGQTDLVPLCLQLLEDPAPEVRIEAAAYLVSKKNKNGEAILQHHWNKGTPLEQQLVVHKLAHSPTPFGNSLIEKAMQTQLASLDRPGPLALDLYEAACSSDNDVLTALARKWESRLQTRDPIAGVYHLALAGGVPSVGKRVFETHAAQCIRCHTIKNVGGEAGPDLSKIARTIDRPAILQSLINPAARVAPGFGIVLIERANAEPIAGFLGEEDETTVAVTTPDGKLVKINKSDITKRSDPVSTMPPMLGVLTPSEMRDLTAYISGLK